jgi:hypothetical protein
VSRVTCRTACFAVAAGVLTLAVLAGPAAAAVPCERRVLDDWVENERIDRVYPIPCYEDAIEAIPHDLRDYSNAADVIARALASALRVESASASDAVATADATAGAPKVEPGAASGLSALPLPLLLAGGVSLALLAAGAVGHLARRRRTDAAHRPGR